ncbi:MAG: hypothetical protein EHM28_06050, partial [Spirochaetaceae bacterium]
MKKSIMACFPVIAGLLCASCNLFFDTEEYHNVAICVNFGYVVPDLSAGTDKVLLVYTATDSGMAGIDTAALFGSLRFPDNWSYGGTELRQQQIPEPGNRYAIIIPLDGRPNDGADFSMSVNRTTVLGESISYQEVNSAYG